MTGKLTERSIFLRSRWPRPVRIACYCTSQRIHTRNLHANSLRSYELRMNWFRSTCNLKGAVNPRCCFCAKIDNSCLLGRILTIYTPRIAKMFWFLAMLRPFQINYIFLGLNKFVLKPWWPAKKANAIKIHSVPFRFFAQWTMPIQMEYSLLLIAD